LAGAQLICPSEDDEQVPDPLSLHVQPASQFASLVHAVCTMTQAKVPVGSQVTSVEHVPYSSRLHPGLEQRSDSSQVKPGPQSLAVVQGSCQRGVQILTVVVVQLGEASSAATRLPQSLSGAQSGSAGAVPGSLAQS
jgi:hypothetical protein